MSIIVIAHRLSTVKAADNIIVLHDGVLKEQGNDKELRVHNGIYANLCRLQDEKENQKDEIDLADIDEEKEETHKGEKESEQLVSTKDASRLDNYKADFMKENCEHSTVLIFSIIFAILGGTFAPITGLLFGRVIVDLSDINNIRHEINIDFIGYIGLGITVLLSNLGMYWLFGYISSSITYKFRQRLYGHILSMDVGWFDLPENVPSTLNSTLSQGTENINEGLKSIAGILIQALSALIIALIIGFIFAWRIALIALPCIPLMFLVGVADTKLEISFAAKNEELYKESMKVLSESVRNIRTVISSSGEIKVLKIYSDALIKPLQESQKVTLISGALHGLGQCLQYFVYAYVFYFAAFFLDKYGDDSRDSFIAVYAIINASSYFGQVQHFSPTMGRAYAALYSIYAILDQKPAISSPENPSKNEIKGKIEFKNVCFKYPGRDEYVLKDFNAAFEIGKKTAIVGTSGSGKSTVIQLLERFYDIESGQILIDGVDIKEYALHDLRRAMGFVPQEPVLFDMTIEENVKYGQESATKEEVVEACQIADAMKFIMKDSDEVKESKDELGSEFDRRVGSKGSLLSGGQKQRLAIARAVLKQPKIMLFDEATSALDSETEKIVQKALNKVSQGRTSIVVAHRLGTIEDSDTILVLENGKIVESGTKQELLGRKGNFYKLHKGIMN